MRKFALCKRGPNVETSLDKAKHATWQTLSPFPWHSQACQVDLLSFLGFSGLFPEGQVQEHHFLG